MMRLELIQANAHYPLKVACLPFHHIRIVVKLVFPLLWDCKVNHCLLNSKHFFKNLSGASRIYIKFYNFASAIHEMGGIGFLLILKQTYNGC